MRAAERRLRRSSLAGASGGEGDGGGGGMVTREYVDAGGRVLMEVDVCV